MAIESTLSQIRQRADMADSIGSTVKFVFKGGEGIIFLDGSGASNTVSTEDRDADCTVSLDIEDMDAMLGGSLNPMMAFMTGKLRIEGDMGVAMKLSSILS
jgi:hypothetical protein